MIIYRNIVIFCILILYPISLLNSLIVLNSFLMDCLGFSIWGLTSSENRGSSTYSFPIWMPHFHSCLIILPMVSCMLLNSSGESGCSCFFLILGEAFSLFPLSMMLVVGFHRCPLSDWENSLLLLLCLGFQSWGS